MITTFYGYLEAAYLIFPYMTGYGVAVTSSQIEFKILDTASRQVQIDQRIEDEKTNLVQIDQKISGTGFSGNTQIDQRIESNKSNLVQVEFKKVDQKSIASQIDQKTITEKIFQAQIEHRISTSKLINTELLGRLEKIKTIHSQLDRKITLAENTVHTELDRGTISHQQCGGYLVFDYLVRPYLVAQICAHMRTQLDQRIADTKTLNAQIEHRLEKTKTVYSQIDQRIEDTKAFGVQLKRIQSKLVNTQLSVVIYNTTNLRILYQFPSRGTSGTNWSVITGGTASGDFGVNNVNTDLVEQCYRSLTTSIILQCDTQITQGIFNDTLAILGHNLTRSASVTLIASNDVTFASVGFSIPLFVETENLYWIAPTLPLVSYRYWRIQISDVTNSFGYIQLGTIVFGNCVLFSGECFVDEVTRRKTHFADRIKTEGFSSISNDRALKRGVSLSFRRLNYNYQNYANLVNVIDTVRTSLKALWIPTPQYASRFAVFGKLSEIPVENHKVISETSDYIDLEINVDEAL